MKNSLSIVFLAGLALATCEMLLPVAAAEGHAHVHGVAKINLSTDDQMLTVFLDSPLDNLLGFEHPPRTSAEQSTATALKAALLSPATLISIDPSGGCVLKHVDLQSAALALGDAPADTDGHGDLEATFQYLCASPAAVKFIDLGFFERFVRIQKIEVEGAVQAGQFKRQIRRPERRVVMP